MREFTSVFGRRFRRASRWAAEGPARRACSGPDVPGCSTAWIQPSVEADPCDWSQVGWPCCLCRVSAASCVLPPPGGAGCAAGRSTSTCLRSGTQVLAVKRPVRLCGFAERFKRASNPTRRCADHVKRTVIMTGDSNGSVILALYCRVSAGKLRDRFLSREDRTGSSRASDSFLVVADLHQRSSLARDKAGFEVASVREMRGRVTLI